MTREEAIKGLTSLVEVRRKYICMQTMKDEIECLDMAIKALEQEPCEDAISRQAVMDTLCNDCELFRNGERTCFTKCEEYHFLATLPSVTPQPDTARRIVGKSRGGMTLWYQCEICNEPVDVQDTFCSGCGRRLVK